MQEPEIDERNLAFLTQDIHQSNPVPTNQVILLHTPERHFRYTKGHPTNHSCAPRNLNHLFTIFYHLLFPL